MPRLSAILLASSFICCALSVLGQWSDPTMSVDPHEVRLNPTWSEPDAAVQSRLRATPFWSEFHESHDCWQAHFDVPDKLSGTAVITGMRRFGEMGVKKVLIETE